MQEVARKVGEMIAAGALKQKNEGAVVLPSEVIWGEGELEFEAYMRMMDSAVSSASDIS